MDKSGVCLTRRPFTIIKIASNVQSEFRTRSLRIDDVSASTNIAPQLTFRTTKTDKRNPIETIKTMNSIQFRLPEYCENYKCLLVEELVFAVHPARMHYGKCVVIGKLVLENARYYLQNVQLKCLGDEYQLPAGSVRILLLTSTADTRPFPVGHFAEVFGEAVLWDTRETTTDRIGVQEDYVAPKTSCELMQMLGNSQMQLERERGAAPRPPTGMSDKSMNSTVKSMLRQQLEAMRTEYEPAIKCYRVNAIDQAEELIACHLELRLVNQMRR